MCKTGNAMRGVVLALMLVSGVASADGACDASRVAEMTTSTLVYAEACNATLDNYGVALGGRSVECQMTQVEANRQFAAVLELKRQGCTSYYAGPSRAQLARLSELGDKFSMLAR